MRKFILVLLAMTAAMMMARLVYDPPVIETRTGLMNAPALPLPETAVAYAGIRG